MVSPIHVCCGTVGKSHEPTRMKVDKNGVSIYRRHPYVDEYEPGHLTLLETGTEVREWLEVDDNYSYDEALQNLFVCGGEYYGEGDRYVCLHCGSTIVWRI